MLTAMTTDTFSSPRPTGDRASRGSNRLARLLAACLFALGCPAPPPAPPGDRTTEEEGSSASGDAGTTSDDAGAGLVVQIIEPTDGEEFAVGASLRIEVVVTETFTVE
jgi:hypothetical protein